MSTQSGPGTALITGASRGIGAVYAERLAARGYDLILVARDQERLEALARRLAAATGRHMRVVAADLAQDEGVRRVEEVLASHDEVSLVINNAGVGSGGSTLVGAEVAQIETLIQVNVVAMTRVARAAALALARRGQGTLVNISSALALHLMPGAAVYSGTKAFVLQFSRVLQQEVAAQGVTIQVVLPGAVSTEIWSSSGVDIASFPPGMVMSAEDLVDAALAGLDQGEAITLPSVPDYADWEKAEALRVTLAQNLSRDKPAPRYGVR